MNLAEFPLAVLSTRVDPRVKTLEFRDTQRLKTGELVERQWIITGADKFGLPTSTDDDVVLGLIRLTMDDGFRNRKVYFTRYELLRILRWTTEGRSYSRLTKSLDRLSGVRIRAANAFFDNSTKAFQTCNFGIIDAYELNDERALRAPAASRTSSDKRGAPEAAPKSFFIWSEMMFESFRSGFIKKIDLELYFKIGSAVSRRLYRYLDKHFYYTPVVERNLMDFAFEKLGLARTYKYVSSVRQQLEPAADELIKHGFLASYSVDGRGADATIRFVAAGQPPSVAASPKPRSAPAIRPPSRPAAIDPSALQGVSHDTAPLPQSVDRAEEVAKQLVSRGLHPAQAAKLLDGREDLVKVEQVISLFDALVKSRDVRVSRSPVGFLYRAVENPERFIRGEQPRHGSPEDDANARRPERRVFSARRVNQPDGTRNPHMSELGPGERKDTGDRSVHAMYRRYLGEQIVLRRGEVSATELSELYDSTVRKLTCLKDVLDDSSFKKAVDGCFEEELAKRLALPDLATWSRQHR
jgi:plasmid replication initiation protein